MRRTPLLVALAAASLVLTPGVARAQRPPVEPRVSQGPSLIVDVGKATRRISPDIYGVNFASAAFARSVALPVDRWGGDSTETYNWTLPGTNDGANYYYENFADCWTDAFKYCTTGHGYNASEAQIAQDRSTHTTTVLTLPAMGYVANKVAFTNTNVCSFPRSTFPNQDDFDPYHDACGNGLLNGKPVGTADPTVAGTKIGPGFDAAWVRHLVGRFHDAKAGGVGVYELGNEPSLWNQTHRDFHPQPLTYDELVSNNRDLAVAVKAADPTAATLGPAEWGWPNYFCSAADNIDNGCFATSPDRAKHGGVPLADYYLQQFRAYQRQHGTRLLDYFDWHYYPAGTYAGARYTPVTDVTRTLDDPRYTDPSYIDSKIDLIPRMRALVAKNYPGTKISITEYNLGLDVTNDKRLQNVIEADTLGIFGREGLDLATYWPEPVAPVPTGAFDIYRNYDGKHHRFGSLGVLAKSSASNKLSVYAARTSAHGALTIVVINKTTTALNSPVNLRNRSVRRTVKAPTYRYAGGKVVRIGSSDVTQQGYDMVFPPESVTLVAVPGS